MQHVLFATFLTHSRKLLLSVIVNIECMKIATHFVVGHCDKLQLLSKIMTTQCLLCRQNYVILLY